MPYVCIVAPKHSYIPRVSILPAPPRVSLDTDALIPPGSPASIETNATSPRSRLSKSKKQLRSSSSKKRRSSRKDDHNGTRPSVLEEEQEEEDDVINVDTVGAENSV